MNTLAKCKCQHCNQWIEFDSDSAGASIACPKCGMDTLLFIPHETPKPASAAERKRASLVDCLQCGHPISGQAVLCMNCGAIPSLFRVGWYVLCIMAAMSIISGIVALAIWAVSNCMSSIPK